MSSYVNNKLQMCSDTQHQCRRRQMCGKLSQIHTVHSLFVSLQKITSVLTEQSLFMVWFQLIMMCSYYSVKQTTHCLICESFHMNTSVVCYLRKRTS